MSISLGFTTEPVTHYSPYVLQNISEQKALSKLKKTKDKSWVFRFDYMRQKYYLTIKNGDEFINHHVYYYNVKTDEIIDKQKYTNLQEYLKHMLQIYNFDLSEQVII